MKVKSIVLIILAYTLSVASTFAHKLIHETFDSKANSASAVYLDEVTGNLIVQKYDLSKSSLKAKDFTFPESVKSFASFYHPVSKLRPEIKEEKTIINIDSSSPKVQIALEKTLGISRKDGNVLIGDIYTAISKETDNKIISNGSNKNESGFAILTDKNGVLIFAKGKREKSTLPSLTIFPRDLVNTLTSKKSKDLDISTPGKIDDVLSNLDSTMDSYDFSKSQKKLLIAELKKKKAELDKFVSNMSLVKSYSKNGEKRELFFDFENGSFYLRTTKNNEIIDDDFFPITNDENLNDLKDKLSRLGLYKDDEFSESFEEFYVRGCESLDSMTSLLPDLDNNISNILKVNNKLWGSYLENAISNKPVVLEDGSIVLSISALSESHSVKISIGEDNRISEINFIDKDKARSDGLVIEEIEENGQHYFKVMSINPDDETTSDQLFFDIEGSSNGGNNLAVYVKGNGVGQDLYDKNTFELTLSANKIKAVGKRVHLSSSREDNYPSSISKGDGQGFKSFFFNSFFDLEGKREKLADEIRSAVDDQIGSINKDGKEYLNKSEINNIVLDIVADVEKDIPKLKASVGKITASTFEHAYKNFISNIVPKMIKELLPDEEESLYSNITEQSMLGLNKCLEKATKKLNEKASASCMDVFVKEAPVTIGEEILKYQLSANGQDILIGTSVSEYNKCIKENYDTTHDMSYIKGCIFKAMFTAVDKDLDSVVRLSLTKMEEDYRKEGKDIKLSLSLSTIKNARSNLRNCYQKKGYITPSLFKENYNQKKLNSLDTDTFKNDLLSCSSQIEQTVGRSVAGSLVEHELKGMNIVGEDNEIIRNYTLDHGYDNCIQIQNGISTRAEKKGQFVKVEATKCTDLITLSATEQVITKTIKDKLGSKLWDELVSKEEAPHISCFEDLLSQSRNELFKVNGEGVDFDKGSATCLKKSVVWASFYLGKEELSKIFKTDPLYRKVSLTDDKRNFFAKLIQKCFEKNLSKLSSVSDVSEGLVKIQDKCTVELVMSDEASKEILSPIVIGMLEDSEVDPTVIKATAELIVKKMRSNVKLTLSKKDLSLDEVIAEFKEIQGEATYLVADSTINKYVEDLVPGENSEKISADIRKSLFIEKHRFKKLLLEASSKEEIDTIINSITEEAAVSLSGHAARSEGLKLLEKGLFKSNLEVEEMAKDAGQIMKSCIESRHESIELKVHLEACILKLKSSLTYNIFDDQLRGILFDGEYSSSFSETEKEEIYQKFINKKLESDIGNAYEKDDLEGLQSSFTLSATSVIGEKVLKQSIQDIYTADTSPSSSAYTVLKSASLIVSKQANNELQSCLSSLKDVKDPDSSECINRARIKATSLIFKEKINPILGVLSSNKSVQNSLADNEVKSLNLCVESNSKTSTEYADIVNSCLIESIFDLVPTLLKKGSESTDLLVNLTDSDLARYELCLEDEKRNTIKNDESLKNDKELRSSLYSDIGKREEFWIGYFQKSKDESQDKVNWAIETVQKCAISGVIPEVITSISNSEGLKDNLSLSASEHTYTKEMLGKLEIFSKETFSKGLWLKLEETSGENKNSQATELSTIEEYLSSYLPMMGDYFKKIHSYDDEGSKEKLDKFLNQIKSELKSKKELSIDELIELLMESELIDLVIESEISNFIKKEAKDPLTKEGVDEATINKLGSKEILGNLFKSEEGRKQISAIKEQFIKPMLNGSGTGEIPPQIVVNVKKLLAKDTKLGGFVETLAGAIIQKNLDDQKPQNFATNGIASIIGYESEDFKWSHLRLRKEEGVKESTQPVAKTLDYFGDQILLPILLNDDLGTEKVDGWIGSSQVDVMDIRKEKLTGMIKGIMGI